MAEETGIEWCDSTFNPWMGCTRVSPACDDCYAARSTPARAMGIAWGTGEPRRRTAADTWAAPKRWAKTLPPKLGRRPRVFCASLADVFDNEVPAGWRVDLFNLIAATPALDWLLLTKRAGNVVPMLRDMGAQHLPGNVWLGATVVNQAEADRDIPKLLATPARVRFLSIEPMLGPVDLDSIPWGGMRCSALRGWAGPQFGVHWVICGGESGPKARPMHPDWARSLRDQCAAAGVPFLFKQWGEWLPCGIEDHGDGPFCIADQAIHHLPTAAELARTEDVNGQMMWRVGKKAAGRVLDGMTHDGFPESR